jgi:magnesium-transporting ATPase (P-type)
VFDPFFISTYNMIYTSAPVIMLGSLEQDVAPRTALRYPRLYEPGLRRLWFSRQEFATFAIHGLVTSLLLIGAIMGKALRRAQLARCMPLCSSFVFYSLLLTPIA